MARALGPRATAEVFVLDAARTLVYRGAIDDQYAVGAALDAPRNTFLRDALDAVLAGRRPAVTATSVPRLPARIRCGGAGAIGAPSS